MTSLHNPAEQVAFCHSIAIVFKWLMFSSSKNNDLNLESESKDAKFSLYSRTDETTRAS